MPFSEFICLHQAHAHTHTQPHKHKTQNKKHREKLSFAAVARWSLLESSNFHRKTIRSLPVNAIIKSASLMFINCVKCRNQHIPRMCLRMHTRNKKNKTFEFFDGDFAGDVAGDFAGDAGDCIATGMVMKQSFES